MHHIVYKFFQFDDHRKQQGIRVDHILDSPKRSGIKSLRNHYVMQLRNQILTFEEFSWAYDTQPKQMHFNVYLQARSVAYVKKARIAYAKKQCIKMEVHYFLASANHPFRFISRLVQYLLLLSSFLQHCSLKSVHIDLSRYYSNLRRS